LPSFEAARTAIGRIESELGQERVRVVEILALALVVKVFLFSISPANRGGFSFSDLEVWNDYAYAYAPSVTAFKSGYLPYVNFYYPYPPLFLYALTAFSYLGASGGAAVPLVLADALTVVPVYLLARRFTSERLAFFASLVFALAPVNLLYADYVWLNPPLTTLFLMTSLYFLLKGRFDLSALTLALSIGLKQTALIVAPLILVFVWRKALRKTALRYLLLVAVVCFAFSVPYLFASPSLYLESIFRLPWFDVSLPQNYFQLLVIPPSITISTINTAALPPFEQTLAHLLGVGYPATLSLPVFVFLLPGLAQSFYSASENVLVLVLAVAYLFLFIKFWRNHQPDDKLLMRYVTYSLLLFFTLYPVYKYYVAGVTPLLALLGYRKRYLGAFFAFNIALILVPSMFASFLPLAALALLLRPSMVKGVEAAASF
jgi:4-amino-4-deoxy-L-arabinose transferase-like glycosyltransferase